MQVHGRSFELGSVSGKQFRFAYRSEPDTQQSALKDLSWHDPVIHSAILDAAMLPVVNGPNWPKLNLPTFDGQSGKGILALKGVCHGTQGTQTSHAGIQT
jgi:hypothetical protein